MSAGRADRIRGRHDARTGDVALLDSLLQGDVIWPTIEAWESEIPHANQKEAHKIITQNFTRAILADEPLIAPGVEGVRGLEIGNAMLMSGITRKPVELPVDGEVFEAFLKDLIKTYGGKKTLRGQEGLMPTDPKFAK